MSYLLEGSFSFKKIVLLMGRDEILRRSLILYLFENFCDIGQTIISKFVLLGNVLHG